MFRVGDIVRIKHNVHDAQMPAFDRKGSIVEIVGKRKDQALIVFSNKNILKFHFCQMESCINTINDIE